MAVKNAIYSRVSRRLVSAHITMRIDFSSTGWARVVAATTVGTVGCIAAALFVDSYNFSSLTEEARSRAILVDILLPTALAAPLLLFLTTKLRELAIANEKLQIVASVDSLTDVLTRGAFTTLVDAYLANFRDDGVRGRGAFLVIDVDEFKCINDEYGHSTGDEVLRLIASSIRSALRSGDLVGRIGGDEFSIFLPGSSPSQASAIAERIRLTVQGSDLLSDRRPLSISVGGATFSAAATFDALFIAADRLLYVAKSRGRNRVEIEPLFDAV